MGFEPMIEVLQTSALPLGYVATHGPILPQSVSVVKPMRFCLSRLLEQVGRRPSQRFDAFFHGFFRQHEIDSITGIDSPQFGFGVGAPRMA